jgi:uncharacterized protein (DUF1778 family)
MSVIKSGRVSARVPSHVYITLRQAAELSGATLNQFLVQSAFEKAQLIIEQERVINMTQQSAGIFFDAIEKPPAPGKKLKKAVKAYKRLKANAKN